MVKSDSHMERVRQRLLDEGAGIKRSEEKRREREGKKFGKQVQQEKLRERALARKDMDEKIKGIKRSAYLSLPVGVSADARPPQSARARWTTATAKTGSTSRWTTTARPSAPSPRARELGGLASRARNATPSSASARPAADARSRIRAIAPTTSAVAEVAAGAVEVAVRAVVRVGAAVQADAAVATAPGVAAGSKPAAADVARSGWARSGG